MHLTGQQTAESQLPSGYSKLGPWLYGLGWLVKKLSLLLGISLSLRMIDPSRHVTRIMMCDTRGFRSPQEINGGHGEC